MTDAIQGVDVYHQLSRLRHGKNLSDMEVELMMRTFAENLQNYDQVVEVRCNGIISSGSVLLSSGY